MIILGVMVLLLLLLSMYKSLILPISQKSVLDVREDIFRDLYKLKVETKQTEAFW